jgi:NADPH:quinone reductase-like Zn-dependent oxidoreductase
VIRRVLVRSLDDITIEQVPAPVPRDDELLVRTTVVGVCGSDTHAAAGHHPFIDLPVVPGHEAAGVVDAVGDGVTGIAVGDHVVGHVPLAPPIKEGTLAEYALLPAETVVVKPAGLDFVTAAAIPLAGAAAIAAVDAVAPQPGETVLIVGAGGGVGSYAVQLAAARGATVIATGLPEDAERLRGLGATEVVDYRQDPAGQVRAARPDEVQALIDLVSRTPDGLAGYAELLADGGRVASSAGAVDEEALAARKITGTNVFATPVREVVGPLVEQAAAGSLRVDVARVLPLHQAPDGLRVLAEGRAHGKLVVRVAD